MDRKREKTNIELVEGDKANDDDRIGTFCFNVAKEDREADENENEEKVGRSGGQGTNEENPCIGLERSQAGEENMKGTVLTVTMSFRATRVVSGIPTIVAAEARRDRHSILTQKNRENREERQRRTEGPEFVFPTSKPDTLF